MSIYRYTAIDDNPGDFSRDPSAPPIRLFSEKAPAENGRDRQARRDEGMWYLKGERAAALLLAG